VVASIVIKYTQSNSVGYAVDGQMIGNVQTTVHAFVFLTTERCRRRGVSSSLCDNLRRRCRSAVASGLCQAGWQQNGNVVPAATSQGRRVRRACNEAVFRVVTNPLIRNVRSSTRRCSDSSSSRIPSEWIVPMHASCTLRESVLRRNRRRSMRSLPR